MACKSCIVWVGISVLVVGTSATITALVTRDKDSTAGQCSTAHSHADIAAFGTYTLYLFDIYTDSLLVNNEDIITVDSGHLWQSVTMRASGRCWAGSGSCAHIVETSELAQ